MKRILTIAVVIVWGLAIGEAAGCGSNTTTVVKQEPLACQENRPVACEEARHPGKLAQTEKEVQEIGERVEASKGK